MPGILLGDTRNETDAYLCLHGAYILVEEQKTRSKREVELTVLRY